MPEPILPIKATKDPFFISKFILLRFYIGFLLSLLIGHDGPANERVSHEFQPKTDKWILPPAIVGLKNVTQVPANNNTNVAAIAKLIVVFLMQNIRFFLSLSNLRVSFVFI